MTALGPQSAGDPLRFCAKPRDEMVAALTMPPPLSPITVEKAQELAVAIAYGGLGRVSPNPLVGAVIVDREHRFVAAGAHRQVGGAHAEIEALRAAAELYGEKAASGEIYRGGTIYVTLEPCAHQGRTPACAVRLAASGLARCVFGTFDPNPLVSGKGAALVAAAGMAADCDERWRPACERLAEVFLHGIREKRPFIGLKVAASLDGMMARQGDERAWITGQRARRFGHFLRVAYDAIMIGRRTLVADDPVLDARDSLMAGRAPQRIVVDPAGAGLAQFHAKGVLPRLAQHQGSGVFWVVGRDVQADAARSEHLAWLADAGVHVLAVARDEAGQLDLAALVAQLGTAGMQSILLEGGSGLYGGFLRLGLVDRVHLFQAPVFLGGDGSLPFVASTGSLASRLVDVELTPLGTDWVLEGRYQKTSTAAN